MAEGRSTCLTGFKPRTNGAGATQHSEFAKRASRIGLGIHSTSQKLSKLAQLAKRTSMFDDPAAEINELTGAYRGCSAQHGMAAIVVLTRPCPSAGVIKQDIQAMNAAIADLQTLSAGSAYDANKQSADHSHVVVDSLRTQLKVSLLLANWLVVAMPCWVAMFYAVIHKAFTRVWPSSGHHEDVQGRHDAPSREPEGQRGPAKALHRHPGERQPLRRTTEYVDACVKRALTSVDTCRDTVKWQ